MPRRNGAKELFLHSENDPRRILPERGLPEISMVPSEAMHRPGDHGTTLWLLAVGALACFLGAVVVAARSTRR